MASQKQIDANRLNALKSTGPRTDETKAISRLNAKRDGITGQVITLSEEDRPVFEALKSELIADLNPQTAMERHLASSIAWDTWRLDHLRAVEANIYALGVTDPEATIDCDDPQIASAMSDALTFQKEAQRFALMSIYEQRLNRGIHKNLTTLKELQAERKRNYEHDLEVEKNLARASQINSLPYQPSARRSENGFIFSTPEVLAAINRQSVVGAALSSSWGDTRIFFEGAFDNLSPNRPDSGPHPGMELAAAA